MLPNESVAVVIMRSVDDMLTTLKSRISEPKVGSMVN